MDVLLIVGLMAYGLCVVMAKGLMFGTAQHNWPTLAQEQYWTDHVLSGALSLTGPIAVFVIIVVTTSGGRRLRFRLY